MSKLQIIGAIIVALSALLIIVCIFKKNETFFNIREVFSKHMKLFKNCKSQYFIFYICPAIFAVGLSLLYDADGAFYEELSVIIGIILSMLFAILSILSGHDFSSVEDGRQRQNIKNVVMETTNAIVFNSILCIFLLLYSLTIIVLNGASVELNSAFVVFSTKIISGIAYYIFTVILLTLFLIIKHMSKIIEVNMIIKKKDRP